MTRCPVCRAELGVPPGFSGRTPEGRPEQPPSFRLQLCPKEDDGTRRWRLSVFDDSWSQQSPGFREADVSRVYHLCGDGHVFLDEVRVAGAVDPGWVSHGMNLVAAAGGAATGKSFLLVRTLNQQLTVTGPPRSRLQATALHVDRLPSDPLENAPGHLLETAYRDTYARHKWIPVTGRYALLPANLLSTRVSPDLVGAIRAGHRELLGAEHAGTSWGLRIRQPIVLRTDISHHRVWTGVADLAGESFDDPNQADEYQQELLRNFGSLLWVVDPVVTSALSNPLDHALGRTSAIPASMRLDTTDQAKVDETRSDRDQHQDDLGARLARVGGMAGHIGNTLRMCVVITKCDLLCYVLGKGQRLATLGRPGAVRDGVARYLDYLARRWDPPRGHPTVRLSADAEQLARYLNEPGSAEDSLRADRLDQVADAVVAHYSDPAQFWALVHEGHGPSVLPVPKGADNTLPGFDIAIPSLDEHILAALQKDEGEVLQVRDVIMSALGCGLMYAFGYAPHLVTMFRQQWRDVRFFLCSPLTTVPVKLDTGPDRIGSLEAGQFPLLHERSAGLSHLLLSILRGART